MQMKGFFQCGFCMYSDSIVEYDREDYDGLSPEQWYCGRCGDTHEFRDCACGEDHRRGKVMEDW